MGLLLGLFVASGWMLGWIPGARGQSVVPPAATDTTALTRDRLDAAPGGTALPVRWRFTPLEQIPARRPPASASPTRVDARLPASGALPDAWNGLGWFEQVLIVDSSLTGVPLGLRLRHYGAARIYVDGELLHAFGQPAATAQEEVPQTHTAPVPLVVRQPGRHVLGVLYSNHAAADLHAVGYDAGFTVEVGRFAAMQAAHEATVRTATAAQFGLTGIYVVFGVLHLLLFAFYRKQRESLYLALVALCIGLILFNNFHEALFYDRPGVLIILRRLWPPLTLLTVLVTLRLVYAVYGKPTSWFFYGLVGIGGALAVWGWFVPSLSWWQPVGGRTYAYVYALLVEAIAVGVIAVNTVGKGRWPDFVALGVLALVLAFSYPLLVVLGAIPPVVNILVFPNVVILGWLIAMSLYLSRKVATTNQRLHEKLDEVTRLSQEKLEQERKLRAQEVEREVMKTEYEQKLRELEEARKLQLSLLPDVMPEHPEVEVAAYMQTATEVGGDYYDFLWNEDGALTLAVGDATGHGMKAGTMVIATKSLFNLIGDDDDLLRTLDRSTRALKRLNMRKLYMALTLARYEAGRLRLATAGMPPTLIYRAADGCVESVPLKGMPLGSFVDFPYQDQNVSLAAGDTVLFMSDGFPELFNEEKEMLGYETVHDIFAKVGDRSAKDIIDHLVETGRSWRNDRPPDDDMTFVVMKVRPVGDVVSASDSAA